MARIQKNCGNCMNGVKNNFNTDIICRYKGVVSNDFSCFKHRLNPDAITLKKPGYNCIDCSYFIINPENSTRSVGYCYLFTVREFDGSKKKICSKFESKSNKGVCAG